MSFVPKFINHMKSFGRFSTADYVAKEKLDGANVTIGKISASVISSILSADYTLKEKAKYGQILKYFEVEYWTDVYTGRDKVWIISKKFPLTPKLTNRDCLDFFLNLSNDVINYIEKNDLIVYGEWMVKHEISYNKDIMKKIHVFSIIEKNMWLPHKDVVAHCTAMKLPFIDIYNHTNLLQSDYGSISEGIVWHLNESVPVEYDSDGYLLNNSKKLLCYKQKNDLPVVAKNKRSKLRSKLINLYKDNKTTLLLIDYEEWMSQDGPTILSEILIPNSFEASTKTVHMMRSIHFETIKAEISQAFYHDNITHKELEDLPEFNKLTDDERINCSKIISDDAKLPFNSFTFKILQTIVDEYVKKNNN